MWNEKAMFHWLKIKERNIINQTDAIGQVPQEIDSEIKMCVRDIYWRVPLRAASLQGMRAAGYSRGRNRTAILFQKNPSLTQGQLWPWGGF